MHVQFFLSIISHSNTFDTSFTTNIEYLIKVALEVPVSGAMYLKCVMIDLCVIYGKTQIIIIAIFFSYSHSCSSRLLLSSIHIDAMRFSYMPLFISLTATFSLLLFSDFLPVSRNSVLALHRFCVIFVTNP